MTDQPMDYHDYLIRRHQQERMAQRFDALFTKDEDHAAAAAWWRCASSPAARC